MTIDLADNASTPFNARWGGSCALPTCERRGVIEQGDVCQFVDEALVHMACARRIARQQTEPLCSTCWHYHAGNECP